MSYIQIIRTLYYVLSGSNIIYSWVDSDTDIAQRITDTALNDSDPNEEIYGFIGFRVGIKDPQDVPQDTWATKFPYELHLRRRILSPDELKELPEEHRSIYTSTEDRAFNIEVAYKHARYDPDIQPHSIITPGPPPLIRREFDITTRTIHLIGKHDFEEMTLQDMSLQNEPGSGGNVVILDAPSETAGILNSIDLGDDHPRFFHELAPPTQVGYFLPLNLGFEAYITMGSRRRNRELAIWFDPINPGDVRFNVNSVDGERPEQTIDYDSW